MAEVPVPRHPGRPPTHPGEVLREDVMPALNLPVSEVARRLGVTRQTLHRLLAERVAVTPEMALRLGRFLGNGAAHWLKLQLAYDLWHAERRVDVSAIPACRAA